MKFPALGVAALVLALGAASGPDAHAQSRGVAQQEISHLLRYIGDSACEFRRNGTWTGDSRVAEAHVRGKYDFLLRIGRIETTQDFIDDAATKSSLSGEPYEIRCGGNSPVPSSVWLREELARYRAAQQSISR